MTIRIGFVMVGATCIHIWVSVSQCQISSDFTQNFRVPKNNLGITVLMQCSMNIF
jgi:hypothetical protein